VSALRRNASQTEAATNMAAIHKQNQIFTTIAGATLGSREGTLVLPRRSSGLSSTLNSSQTLRHIAIKATVRVLVRTAHLKFSTMAIELCGRCWANRTMRPSREASRLGSPSARGEYSICMTAFNRRVLKL
jgi:hypothetical protein